VHTTLITVHATAAVLSLVAAVVVLLPRGLAPAAARAVAGVLVAATAVMALSLAGAVAVGWADQPPPARGVFTALVVLATAAAVQSVLAVPAAQRQDRAQVARLYGAGGFVLITQATGFAAIAVLDVLSVAGVVIVAVATVLALRALVGQLRAAAERTSPVAPAG